MTKGLCCFGGAPLTIGILDHREVSMIHICVERAAQADRHVQLVFLPRYWSLLLLSFR